MTTPCPKCGQQTTAEATVCTQCGHALRNGTVPQAHPQKPPPPPELADYVFQKVSSEAIEKALGPFNLEEFPAAVREIEATGGVKFEDFIGEIEEIVNRRD